MRNSAAMNAVKLLVDNLDSRGSEMAMDEIRAQLAEVLAIAKDTEAIAPDKPVFIILQMNQLNYEVNNECHVTHYGSNAPHGSATVTSGNET